MVLPSLKFLSIALTIKSSVIGPFQLPVFNQILAFVCTDLIVPVALSRFLSLLVPKHISTHHVPQSVNVYLSKGFPIPVVQGLTFVNPTVKFDQGYVLIETDIAYNPPSLSDSPIAPPASMLRGNSVTVEDV